MGKVINLIGKRFGKLVVVQRVDNDRNGRARWLCLCDCGNEKEIMSSSLLSENTRSCGCLLSPDLTGVTFGSLVVIEKLENIILSNGNIRTCWKCLCECGNYKNVSSDRLVSSTVKSCGCLSESWIAKETKTYFEKKYNSISEYKIFKNKKTNHFLPYDIYIPSLNIFIEINGQQHYEYISSWHRNRETFKYSRYKDKLKKRYAEKNGTFIEIDLRKIRDVEQVIEKIEKVINKILGDKNES